MSAEIADFAMKAVMGLSGAYLAEANANAANTVNEANAYASNLVRTANNQLRGAKGSLARFTQSVNNQRTLDNAGSQAEAAAVNYRRARDSATQDAFETQLSFAEQAGAQAAAGAFSGLVGGVSDVVRGTTALRKARIQQRTETALKQGDFDAAQQQKLIMQAGWDNLDHSDVTDTIDYGMDVAVKQSSNTSFLGAILQGQSGKSLSNIGAYAGNKISGWFNTPAEANKQEPVGAYIG